MPCEVLCIKMNSCFAASLTTVYKRPQGSTGHAKQQAVMHHAADSHISHLGVSVVLVQQNVLGLQLQENLERCHMSAWTCENNSM